MSRILFALVFLSNCAVVSQMNADDMEARILKYFPGKWEYKSDDGSMKGKADWSLVAGGRAVAGPGTSQDGASFAMASWDAKQKLWVHNWKSENGVRGHLNVKKFEGDTYYGDGYITQPDGSVDEFKWENKILDKDRFVITQIMTDKKIINRWNRVKK